MDSEEKKEDSKEFGKVIDALHSKQKLSSLRTYQGDVAEFIKNKDESVVSVVLKEKERKEDREEKIEAEEKYEPYEKSASKKDGFQINLTILFLSIFLIGGGALASLYIFNFIKKGPPSEVILKTEIIPYNNLITLANITSTNLGTELSKLSPQNGISILKISNASGNLLLKAKDFFNFLNILLPATIGRTLKDEYVFGIISQNNQTSNFIIISVNDFGQAFSGMLDWEENMPNDLSFLSTEKSTLLVANINTNIATTTTTKTVANTTIISVKIPMKPEIFGWKDLIIKNKDTRGLVNEKGQSKIAYSFLDKNTILIVNDISSIGDISSAYASRSVAR